MMNKCETVMPISPMTFEQMNIIINSQRIWQQLTYWLRSLMVTTLRDPERQPSTLDRLYIGTTREYYNYFRLLYGPEVAQYILQILSGTVIDFLNLIDGVKNNNTDQANSSALKLYEKADMFSAYLHQLNSNWNELQWKNYLYQLIKLLIEQIVAMASENFKDEIAITGRIEDLTAEMGNYMARGVIKNMPIQ